MQQIEAQMRRNIPAPMSLDQVEAQLRSGPPRNDNYRPGIEPSFGSPMNQNFNRSNMPGPSSGQMQQQPRIPMNSRQPMHPQPHGQIQRPMYLPNSGHLQQMQRPIQHMGPGQLHRPMQQLGLGQMQRPSQDFEQIERPAMPRTIVVDGITVTPIDLTNQEKDTVFHQVTGILILVTSNAAYGSSY